MDLASLAAFAGTLLIAAAFPGPGVIAIVARALGSGFARTLPMVAGFVVGDVVYMSLVALGLAVLAAEFSGAFLVLKYAGVAYLLYLAWRLWTSPAPVAAAPAAGGGSGTRLFLTGLAVSLGNPKVMVFYVALLPAIVDLEHLRFAGYLELAAVIVLVAGAVGVGYAALAARARAFVGGRRAGRWLGRSAGAAMAGAAAGVALS